MQGASLKGGTVKKAAGMCNDCHFWEPLPPLRAGPKTTSLPSQPLSSPALGALQPHWFLMLRGGCVHLSNASCVSGDKGRGSPGWGGRMQRPWHLFPSMVRVPREIQRINSSAPAGPRL